MTDAMRSMAQSRPMFGTRIDGQRHDIGNKLDFIKTNIHYALKHPDIKDELSAFLDEMVKKRFQQ